MFQRWISKRRQSKEGCSTYRTRCMAANNDDTAVNNKTKDYIRRKIWRMIIMTTNPIFRSIKGGQAIQGKPRVQTTFNEAQPPALFQRLKIDFRRLITTATESKSYLKPI